MRKKSVKSLLMLCLVFVLMGAMENPVKYEDTSYETNMEPYSDSENIIERR